MKRGKMEVMEVYCFRLNLSLSPLIYKNKKRGRMTKLFLINRKVKEFLLKNIPIDVVKIIAEYCDTSISQGNSLLVSAPCLSDIKSITNIELKFPNYRDLFTCNYFVKFIIDKVNDKHGRCDNRIEWECVDWNTENRSLRRVIPY
jgi:hypothetical protein